MRRQRLPAGRFGMEEAVQVVGGVGVVRMGAWLRSACVRGKRRSPPSSLCGGWVAGSKAMEEGSVFVARQIERDPDQLAAQMDGL